MGGFIIVGMCKYENSLSSVIRSIMLMKVQIYWLVNISKKVLEWDYFWFYLHLESRELWWIFLGYWYSLSIYCQLGSEGSCSSSVTDVPALRLFLCKVWVILNWSWIWAKTVYSALTQVICGHMLPSTISTTVFVNPNRQNEKQNVVAS